MFRRGLLHEFFSVNVILGLCERYSREYAVAQLFIIWMFNDLAYGGAFPSEFFNRLPPAISFQ